MREGRVYREVAKVAKGRKEEKWNVGFEFWMKEEEDFLTTNFTNIHE